MKFEKALEEELVLKPCPFCGSKAKLSRAYTLIEYFEISCDRIKCSLKTPPISDKNELIKIWNGRA